MDRIAIISDIHGNMPALEAVFADIEKRGITRIFCLGDLAGKGPAPAEAVSAIMEKCEVVVKGNWDYIISEDYDCEPFNWHRARLSVEQLEYLRGLPVYYEFMISGRTLRICHAAPFGVFHRVHSTASVEDKLVLFGGVEGAECDTVGYGDIHGAYVQHFRGKTIFNVGSVGNPLDITQSAYGIIEGEYGSSEQGIFSVTIVRVPYDIEKAVSLAEESDMPDCDFFINELRTGKYRGAR